MARIGKKVDETLFGFDGRVVSETSLFGRIRIVFAKHAHGVRRRASKFALWTCRHRLAPPSKADRLLILRSLK